jgi:copper homeostasis protein
MHSIIFELCAETIDACLAAKSGGAARIELCSALSEGGLTPSHGLIREAVRLSHLPIHVMVRPRGGEYTYSIQEIAIMREDILHLKTLGIAGIVIGLLKVDDSIDIGNTKELIDLARPLEVTFHRAFDRTPSTSQALEDIITTGCDRLLTSGGEDDVVTGAESLASLVSQARGRIEIAAGGGLRIANAASIAKITGVTSFHGSLREEKFPQVSVAAVQAMIEQLHLGRDI